MDIQEEMIEAYLTNKLSANEKQEFENALAKNAELQKQISLESSIIETVKKARIAELKATLNGVKVDNTLFARNVAIATTLVGILALFLFFYPKEKTLEAPANKIAVLEKVKDKVVKPSTETTPIVPKEEPVKKETTPKNNLKPSIEQSKPAKRTPIEVLDPSEEFESTASNEIISITPERNIISLANITVENETSDKRYTFHYKFHKGKLILYGIFDNSLYEILEINGGNRAVFLFYKEHYYLLDENQKKIKMLEAIQDSSLIQKLNEYRLAKK